LACAHLASRIFKYAWDTCLNSIANERGNYLQRGHNIALLATCGCSKGPVVVYSVLRDSAMRFMVNYDLAVRSRSTRASSSWSRRLPQVSLCTPVLIPHTTRRASEGRTCDPPEISHPRRRTRGDEPACLTRTRSDSAWTVSPATNAALPNPGFYQQPGSISASAATRIAPC